jgi:hypothetical protein
MKTRLTLVSPLFAATVLAASSPAFAQATPFAAVPFHDPGQLEQWSSSNDSAFADASSGSIRKKARQFTERSDGF